MEDILVRVNTDGEHDEFHDAVEPDFQTPRAAPAAEHNDADDEVEADALERSNSAMPAEVLGALDSASSWFVEARKVATFYSAALFSKAPANVEQPASEEEESVSNRWLRLDMLQT